MNGREYRRSKRRTVNYGPEIGLADPVLPRAPAMFPPPISRTSPRTRHQRQRWRPVFAGLTALLWLFDAGLATATSDRPRTRPSILLGGPGLLGRDEAPKRERYIDPKLPTGPHFATTAGRSEGFETPACAARAPVCVSPARGISKQQSLAYLSELENAYEALVDAVGLPAPKLRWLSGVGPRLVLRLLAGHSQLRTERHPLLVRGLHDGAHASSECSVGTGQPARRASFLCVAEAVAWGLDATEGPQARRSYAVNLWWSYGSPSAQDLHAIDRVQANPHLSLLGKSASSQSEGNALFLHFLERQLSAQSPAGFSTTLFAVAAGAHTRPAWQWNNEPDWLDVLRHSFPNKQRDLADLLGDFSVARALLGSRQAAGDWPELDWARSVGGVRFEWRVPFSSLPRNLAPDHPIEATGSSYVWIDLDRTSADQSLGFDAHWERPVSFKWVILLIGASGEILQRLDLPYLESANQQQATFEHIHTGKALLICGTNIGGVSLLHPFDPDLEPWEPHSYTLHLGVL